MNKEPVIDCSGNVFADLGFSAEESTLLAMRAELMTRLRDTIKQRGWTQQEAAEKLGIGQSRVSDADAWQMGKIQPGYADYIDHPHWSTCGAGCRVRVIDQCTS